MDLIFRIAAIGIVVAVLSQLLSKSGRDDMATMVAIAGLVIVLVMVIGVISDLFESVKNVFNLYKEAKHDKDRIHWHHRRIADAGTPAY